MSTEQEKYKNTSKAEGSWVRDPTKFHDKISSQSGAKYPPEIGRYRLYVSFACSWAHRTLIVRKLKGLEEAIKLTVTDYNLPNLGLTPEQSEEYKGWAFVENVADDENVHFEPHGFKFLGELYEHASPGYKVAYKKLGRRPVYSVPVLFDEQTQTIVANESAEIIQMLNSEFNAVAKHPELDLAPATLAQEMERVNSVVYGGINDGVYRCGFARTQQAYEDAYKAHWLAMDEIELLLGDRKYLTGDQLTLSDIRLFVTLIRYDAVYYAHFKTSRNKITDMPNLFRFLKDIYNLDGIKETVFIDHIVKHYYGSQKMINPTGIWPIGMLQDTPLKYLEK